MKLLVRQGRIQPPKPHATFDCGAGHEGVRRAGFGLETGSITSDEKRNTFVVSKVSATIDGNQINGG
ncbi:hypothetical protein [Burkholderia stagnalis]|uniref:hypothetical protein n=1 Tax=Burkholderia stagnalis TaxID=1503054 RepID=UPI000AE4363C|nr:hypothetical protein [Burkholderia stagnalis]